MDIFIIVVVCVIPALLSLYLFIRMENKRSKENEEVMRAMARAESEIRRKYE